MYRLVYVSEAASDLDDNAIEAILDTSQSNNHERYITGFLAHNGIGFMQALEGEEAEVLSLFDRILADTRHKNIVQISGEQIEVRAFPNWDIN